MSIESQGTNTKLPWQTGTDAWKTAWLHRTQLLRISWLWLLFLIPATFVYYWVTWPFSQNAPRSQSFLATVAVSLAPEILAALAASSIAVAIHRLILTGEHVTTSTYFTLDATTLKYFAVIAASLLYFYLPVEWFFYSGDAPASPSIPPDALPAETAPKTEPESETTTSQTLISMWVAISVLLGIAITTFGPLLLFAAYIPARLSLTLPAIALQRNFNFRASWTATRGNFSRILNAYATAIFPSLVTLVFVPSLLSPGRTEFAFYQAVITAIIFVTGIVAIINLSLIYQRLAPNDPSPNQI